LNLVYGLQVSLDTIAMLQISASGGTSESKRAVVSPKIAHSTRQQIASFSLRRLCFGNGYSRETFK
jgi:hypothetical protein